MYKKMIIVMIILTGLFLSTGSLIQEQKITKISVMQGEQITITGIPPSQLGGQMGIDYSRTFFFNSSMFGPCYNNDWTMTCVANSIGKDNFYVEIYRDNHRSMYQSDMVEVTVLPYKSITILSPNGGEKLMDGKTYVIQWESTGVNKVIIQIEKKGLESRCLAYSVPASLGKFNFEVAGFEAENDYKINIWDSSNPNIRDSSDDYFKVVPKTTTSTFNTSVGVTFPTFTSIKVISPNGGENLINGATYNIQWESTGVDKVTILLYKKSISGGWPVASNLSASLGKFSINILDYMETGDNDYKIHIHDSNNQEIIDSSDDYFSITDYPPIGVAPPKKVTQNKTV